MIFLKLSAMVIAKKFVLANYFTKEPKRTDFLLVEEELPALKDGEFLIQAEYLSVDPYMRILAELTERSPIGETMVGVQVAKILESRHQDFPVGNRFIAYAGWRTHTVIDGYNLNRLQGFGLPQYILPDLGSFSASLNLGILGPPGASAYFGVIEILHPKAGETLVVSGAAGAVGSHAGQIGKILGLTVIGIAGSDAKCKWLTDELGFDHAINYKSQDIATALKAAAPNKVDCYFDNVGGEISSIIMSQMNAYGRVSVCGSISVYNADPDAVPLCPVIQPAIVFSQLKIEGWFAARWVDRWMEAYEQNLQWLKEDKLKYHETITNGFENMCDAFIGILRGENTGKAIVKA